MKQLKQEFYCWGLFSIINTLLFLGFLLGSIDLGLYSDNTIAFIFITIAAIGTFGTTIFAYYRTKDARARYLAQVSLLPPADSSTF